MTRRVALFSVVSLSLLSAEALAQTCTTPSTAAAPYYAGMTTGANRLTPIELINHSATRLGFGVAPFDTITPANVNICARNTFAERIAAQVAELGAKPDTASFTFIKPRLFPFAMYSRKDINATLNRFVAAGRQDAMGILQWRAWQHLAMMATLREVTGSQSGPVAGPTTDAQVNLDALFTEFWFNHFNVSASKSTQYVFGTDGYQPTIRANIGGTFYSLLRAVMRHPAMLVFLDNAENRYDAATDAASNQNLARELLELHTFGMKPKADASDPSSIYGQDDIVALAKILAGWNAYPYTAAPTNDGFVFNTALAANVSVTFMGTAYANTGATRVESVLNWLANHASTKSAICTKLAAKLYTPSLIAGPRDACIAAWGTDGNLKAMYGALIAHADFWNKSNFRTLYRTPVELTANGFRRLGYSIEDLYYTTNQEGRTGNEFPLLTITPTDFMTRLDQLQASRAWTSLWLSTSVTERLMGIFRMNYAAPTGYSNDGSTFFNSGYIEQVSRTSLALAGIIDYLNEAHRTDVTSPARDAALLTGVSQVGTAARFETFLASDLRIGGILNAAAATRTPAPYVIQSQHESIFLSVGGTNAQWVSWWDVPTARYIAKTWGSMSVGNVYELKR